MQTSHGKNRRFFAGKHFARIRDVFRIECASNTLHQCNVLLAEHFTEIITFFHADAMFAGGGAALVERPFHQPFTRERVWRLTQPDSATG
mgnify:CR=1 FL=1